MKTLSLILGAAAFFFAMTTVHRSMEASNASSQLRATKQALRNATEESARQKKSVDALEDKLAEQSREIQNLTRSMAVVTQPTVASENTAEEQQSFAQQPPKIDVDPKWKTKTYSFEELRGDNGRILATNVVFRALNGLKLSFRSGRTSQEFHVDDLHPLVPIYLELDLATVRRNIQDRATAAYAEGKRQEWIQKMRNEKAVEFQAMSEADRNAKMGAAAVIAAQAQQDMVLATERQADALNSQAAALRDNTWATESLQRSVEELRDSPPQVIVVKPPTRPRLAREERAWEAVKNR